MARPTARKVGEEAVGALERGADARERFAEAGHRDLPQAAPFGAEEDFSARAAELRRRLRSSVDSSETIRADRDRDGPA